MKRTSIALGLVSLAFAPAYAAGPQKPLAGANCFSASAALSCLEAEALPRHISTPPATARAVLDIYLAQRGPVDGAQASNDGAASGYRLAEAGLSDGRLNPEAGQTGWRLDAVSELRSLWGGSSGGAAVRMAQAVTPEQLDKALADHMAQREFWNKAKAEGDGQPVGVQQKDLDEGLAALLEERASWGTSPSKRVADFGDDQRGWKLSDILNLRALLGGGSKTADAGAQTGEGSRTATPEELDKALKALLAQRDEWAAGRDKTQAAQAATGEASSPDVAQAASQAVSQADIAAALDALLSERASWGTAPWDSPAPKAAAAAPAVSPEAVEKPAESAASLASLSTVDLESLLRQRAVWGAGPEARKIAAPLAAGAKFPLPKQERKAVAKAGPEPIVHAAEITPVATLTPVPAEDIDAALSALFKQREAWAQGGNAAEASGEVAANGASGATVSGLPALSTLSLDGLLAQRAKWGSGVEGTPVEAPLAAGAEFPLPKSAARPAVANASEPIVHAADNAPVAELTPVAPAELASALNALLEERASWGTEPSIGDGLRPYASLITSSLEELLAERAKWGIGDPPAPVSAPLAAGAVVPLPKQEATGPVAKSADPIVHAAEITPAVKLKQIDPDELAKALKMVLAERANAGKASVKTANSAKAVKAAKVDDAEKASAESGKSNADALASLLKERASWGKAPTRLPERKIEATQIEQAAAADSADAAGAGSADQSYANLSTESLSELLKQRAQWGGQDSSEQPAAAASTKLEAKPVPTQTGALPPYENVATSCGRELASIVSERPIEFGPSSAAIDADSRAVLKEIGELARSCPGVRFRIEGHTDASGTAGKNQILSEARARSVMMYLVSFGIEKSRLSAIGFGETKPIAGNDSAQDRAKNRRIEFVPVIE